MPEVDVDTVVRSVLEAFDDCTTVVAELEVNDVADVNAVDEVHRVGGDHNADVGQGALLADDVHDGALVAVVEVGVGLVVDNDGLGGRFGVRLPHCGEFGGLQEVTGPLPHSERDAPGAALARAGQVHRFTVGLGDFQRGTLEPALEGNLGPDLHPDELAAVLADVPAQRVRLLLQPLGDLLLDLTDLPLEGLVFKMGFVATAQGGAHRVVGALVLATERQQPGQAFLENLGQRLPLLNLGRSAGIGRDGCKQVILQRARRGQAILRDEVGQGRLQQPAQPTQTTVGGLGTEELPAGHLPGTRAAADAHRQRQSAGFLLRGIEGERAFHPGLRAALPLGVLPLLVGAVLIGEAMSSQEEGQRSQDGTLTSVVASGQDRRAADRDVPHAGQGAEAGRGEGVEVHRELLRISLPV
ncbi:hypothetical protein [Streptomyces sp. NPDC058228]|uniref:hypothetical protein n=1 Tax=Streptomyces sp. NPDC058228 TaxID=3346390 RepID=UPI0036E15702